MALLATFACARPSGPEQALRSFVDAARKGDAPAAYRLLCPSTRQAYEEQLGPLRDAGAGVLKVEPAALLLQGSLRPPSSRELELTVASADESTAWLEVRHDGMSQRVQVLKDSGRWCLELKPHVMNNDASDGGSNVPAAPGPKEEPEP